LSAAVAHALTSGDAVLLRWALWPDGAAAPLGRHPGLPRSGDGVADRARDDAVDAAGATDVARQHGASRVYPRHGARERLCVCVSPHGRLRRRFAHSCVGTLGTVLAGFGVQRVGEDARGEALEAGAERRILARVGSAGRFRGGISMM
jgi:hypothetical protein